MAVLHRFYCRSRSDSFQSPTKVGERCVCQKGEENLCQDFMDIEHCNSYTMGCLPVCGDNLRALAHGLSYVQVLKNAITILNHLHQ